LSNVVGAFGVDKRICAQLAYEAVMEFAGQSAGRHLRHVHFVNIDRETSCVMAEVMKELRDWKYKWPAAGANDGGLVPHHGGQSEPLTDVEAHSLERKLSDGAKSKESVRGNGFRTDGEVRSRRQVSPASDSGSWLLVSSGKMNHVTEIGGNSAAEVTDASETKRQGVSASHGVPVYRPAQRRGDQTGVECKECLKQDCGKGKCVCCERVTSGEGEKYHGEKQRGEPDTNDVRAEGECSRGGSRMLKKDDENVGRKYHGGADDGTAGSPEPEVVLKCRRQRVLVNQGVDTEQTGGGADMESDDADSGVGLDRAEASKRRGTRVLKNGGVGDLPTAEAGNTVHTCHYYYYYYCYFYYYTATSL